MQYDPTQPHWSIMTKTRAGNVSVVKGLTLDHAAKTYERLDPQYGMSRVEFSTHRDYLSEGIISSGSSVGWSIFRPDDIVLRDVFGPPGWTGFEPGTINRWPIEYTIYTDGDGEILPAEYQEHPGLAESARQARKRATRQRKAAAPKSWVQRVFG